MKMSIGSNNASHNFYIIIFYVINVMMIIIEVSLCSFACFMCIALFFCLFLCSILVIFVCNIDVYTVVNKQFSKTTSPSCRPAEEYYNCRREEQRVQNMPKTVHLQINTMHYRQEIGKYRFLKCQFYFSYNWKTQKTRHQQYSSVKGPSNV